MKWFGSHLVAILLGAGLALAGAQLVRTTDSEPDLLLMSPPWPPSMLGDVSEADYLRRLEFRWDVLADQVRVD